MEVAEGTGPFFRLLAPNVNEDWFNELLARLDEPKLGVAKALLPGADDEDGAPN